MYRVDADRIVYRVLISSSLNFVFSQQKIKLWGGPSECIWGIFGRICPCEDYGGVNGNTRTRKTELKTGSRHWKSNYCISIGLWKARDRPRTEAPYLAVNPPGSAHLRRTKWFDSHEASLCHIDSRFGAILNICFIYLWNLITMEL